MGNWWQAFFDDDYLHIWKQVFNDTVSRGQAKALWSMLDLDPGCRILDAPCGWGRLSRPLAELGANVLGVDQSQVQVAEAERLREDLPPDRLRYMRHDLRQPLDETGFDVAINIFTSFGYGTEEEDLAIFRTMRAAVRPGGRLVVETNHRDLMCSYIARGTNTSMRMPDGTLFVDEAEFDAISGILHIHWYWAGPNGSGEKHAEWRCYTPTGLVRLLADAGWDFAAAYQGLSKTPYKAAAPDAGGRLAIVGVRKD